MTPLQRFRAGQSIDTAELADLLRSPLVTDQERVRIRWLLAVAVQSGIFPPAVTGPSDRYYLTSPIAPERFQS